MGDDSEIARVVSAAIAEHRVLEMDYYKEDEDEVTAGRRIEPYLRYNGNKRRYIHSCDPPKNDRRTFRLDRIKEARRIGESFETRPELKPDVPEWTRTDEVPESQPCRVWFAPERARWAREDTRVIEELKDGAVIVEIQFAGHDWLSRAIL